jgi:hypothetical protein
MSLTPRIIGLAWLSAFAIGSLPLVKVRAGREV